MKTKQMIAVLGAVLTVLVVALVSWAVMHHSGQKASVSAGSHAKEAYNPCEYYPTIHNTNNQPVKVPKDPKGCLLPQDGEPADPESPGYLTHRPDGVEFQYTPDRYVMAVSRSDGPTDFKGKIPIGYTHTPQGAALAATNILSGTFAKTEVCLEAADLEYSYSSHSIGVDEQKKQQVCRREAKSRDKIVKRLEEGDFNPELGFTVPIGYRVASYQDDAAVVQVWYEKSLTGNKDKGYAFVTVNMVWVDDQWVMGQQSDDKATDAANLVEGVVKWRA